MEVHLANREKTAFVVPSGLHEFKTMPFGQVSAQATFQHLRNTVLQSLVPKACLVYLGDAVVHDKNADGYMKNLRQVFLRLSEAGSEFNPEKFNFMQSSVKYLNTVCPQTV